MDLIETKPFLFGIVVGLVCAALNFPLWMTLVTIFLAGMIYGHYNK